MANKIVYRTEDEVRDSAKIQLGFDKVESNAKQGTGQITTFNQLGFKGIIDKPDGWYLPNKTNEVALIFELKASKFDLQQQKYVDELLKNVNGSRFTLCVAAAKRAHQLDRGAEQLNEKDVAERNIRMSAAFYIMALILECSKTIPNCAT